MPFHDMLNHGVMSVSIGVPMAAMPYRPSAEPGAGTHCAGCAARHIGLCDALVDIDLPELAAAAQWRTIRSGALLMTEGDPARYFFNINHGTAKVYRDLPDGRRQITGFVTAGYFVGLGMPANYSASVEALEDVRLCRFDRLTLRALFVTFPSLERKLLIATGNELLIAQAQMLLLGRKSALERLASFLLAWIEPASPAGTRLPMGRSDIADYLGLTIETVSRNFTILRQRRLIAISTEQEITIVNCAGLTGIAIGAAA
ncbi:transcriptional regulator, Crp/Fnr family [Acidiphilium rubrum]|uniref:Transcriptional regulator, Crp/Fnr family n=3 Tax=Acidiphilium TaxID=522 RepID=A0A8G2FDT5_ACIRU|nr:transcriptional regulator, Crp/Fnr family [Acidiphilium rubrum]